MLLTFDKLYAILRRDLLTAVRYRSGFVLTMVGVLSELAAFYFLSRAIGPGFRPDGLDYFPFVLVGTGLFTFFVMTTHAFLSTIEQAQQTGTLEVLMTTSTAPAELLILSSASAFAGRLVHLLVYLFLGAVVFRASVHANYLACITVLVLSLGLATALGVFAATLQVAFQKGAAVTWLLGSGLWLLSGTLFPVQSLPRSLQLLGRAIPITYAIDGLRGAFLEGKSPATMGTGLAALAGFVAVLLPLALAGLLISLRRARREGTLSFY